MKEENKIILYQDDNEITRVSVRFADEDLWLTQNQLADIYQTSKSNVSEHIKHIFEDRELDKTVVVRNFRTTESLSSSPSSNICLICSLTFDLLVW